MSLVLRTIAKNSPLSRLDQTLERRLSHVHVGGYDYVLEGLDDLDKVIQQTLTRLPRGCAGEDHTGEVCPHFGVLWPSAVALAEHVSQFLAHGPLPSAAIELGCGLALPSLVARRCGVPSVLATDRHPLVAAFLARNAAANGLTGVAYEALDWRSPDHETSGSDGTAGFDLVMGSDLLYEPWQPASLARTIPRLLKPSGTMLLADPGRRQVDLFVTLLEGVGFSCELSALPVIPSGRSQVEVLVLTIHRHAAP